MRIDEQGRTWFENGDRVKPKAVHAVEQDEDGVNHKVLAPHPKALGKVQLQGEGHIALHEEDTVCAVDWASGQIQLQSWLPQGGSTGGLRTRWDSPDWYELVKDVRPEPPKKRGGRPATAPEG